jgi:hypothetical protein
MKLNRNKLNIIRRLAGEEVRSSAFLPAALHAMRMAAGDGGRHNTLMTSDKTYANIAKNIREARDEIRGSNSIDMWTKMKKDVQENMRKPCCLMVNKFDTVTERSAHSILSWVGRHATVKASSGAVRRMFDMDSEANDDSRMLRNVYEYGAMKRLLGDSPELMSVRAVIPIDYKNNNMPKAKGATIPLAVIPAYQGDGYEVSKVFGYCVVKGRKFLTKVPNSGTMPSGAHWQWGYWVNVRATRTEDVIDESGAAEQLPDLINRLQERVVHYVSSRL